MDDTIQLVPAKFKNMYRVWMENVHDWCISRQLWWGQRIPAFYMQDGTIIVAKNKHEALEKVQHEKLLFAMTEADLTQDEDVLDTWFSSWLWPMSVFNGLKEPENADINYYYPTNDLVTAPEILFFWVARMIIAGYEYRGEAPFKNVYLTGIVRDKLGRKMSKSLGNSPDPLDLIDKYGADGVRTGMLFSSAAGNDLMFDEKLVEQGRNFSNKVWNAFRLVKGWTVDSSLPRVTQNELSIAWFDAKFNQTLTEVEDLFIKFRISEALQAIYKLIWDDFCSQYLELIKPAFEQPIESVTFDATINFFEKLMGLAHPFMPFITEEIWQDIRKRKAGESICIAPFPIPEVVDQQILVSFEEFFEIVSNVRNIRNAKQISPKTALPLTIKTPLPDRFQPFESLIRKMANVSTINYVSELPETESSASISFLIKSDEFFVNIAGQIDTEQEITNTRKDLDYNVGFRDSVLKKLSNDKFVANAKPDVIERERQKLADADAKIQSLTQRLTDLGA